jgi:hypothetical protein
MGQNSQIPNLLSSQCRKCATYILYEQKVFLSEAESYLRTAQLPSSVTAKLVVEIMLLSFKAVIGKFDFQSYLLFLFFSNLMMKKEHPVRNLCLVKKASLNVES